MTPTLVFSEWTSIAFFQDQVAEFLKERREMQELEDHN